ncbi:hypothetical protein LDENG_00023230 [Lucifuga dentata]|nr:hypothetical protein LDENG_00023230 [Lucifuga dentata]
MSIYKNVFVRYFELPLECHTASLFYTSTSDVISSDSTNVKMLWQRDLEEEIGQERWLNILAECGKHVKEVRGKFTQYKILHRYYFTPVRLCRMKLMNNMLCWKCGTVTGTFLHCVWECFLIRPFWAEVLEILSGWYGSKIPLTPSLCLLGDRSQMPNISKRAFSVIMVGVVTASRIILRHWKTTRAPHMKEWVAAMVETASCESMLNRLKGEMDIISLWDTFWTHIKITDLED